MKDRKDSRSTYADREDPYAVTTHELTDDVDVYTYGITVDKVDKNGTPLAGAKFKVTKDGTPLKWICAAG